MPPSFREAAAWDRAAAGRGDRVAADLEEAAEDEYDDGGDDDDEEEEEEEEEGEGEDHLLGGLDEQLDDVFDAAGAAGMPPSSLPDAPGAFPSDRRGERIRPQEGGGPADSENGDDGELTRRGRELIVRFLKEHTCYDPLPVSFKLIVLDTALLVKKALAAMIQNGIVSAPLWNSAKRNFAGMLTVSTFVRLFHKYSSHPSPAAALEEIEQLQVQGWQDMERKAGAADPSLLKLHPSESLYEATKLLVNSRSHKLPVVDVDSTSKRELVVSVLTQYRIIKYIAANCRQWTSLLRQSLAELRIGTYENLVTATLDTSVVHLINLFVKKSITVVPILENGNPGDRRFFSSVRLRDAGPHLRLCKGLVSLTFLDVFRTSTGIVVNVYEQRDVMNLARGGLHYDLSMPVSEALLLRPETFEGVHTCTPDESLCSVFETMKTSPVHRLIVVDVDNSLVGVVSLGDLLKFFID